MSRANGDATHDNGEPKGLICPRCGCRHFYVIYTRPRPNGVVFRLRECRHCGKRKSSAEKFTG